MSDLLDEQLQTQRSITRALDNFRKLGKNNLTLGKIHSRISALKESWVQFQRGHRVLAKVVPPANKETFDYLKDDPYDRTEEAYLTTLDYMTECKLDLEPSVSAQNLSALEVPPATSSSSSSQLPAINLQSYDGNYEEWEHFRDRFTSLIIENRNVSSFNRMHYLASCLRGRALSCIESFPLNADSFPAAWKLLTERFENKRLLVNRHLATLLSLPSVSRESVEELQTLRDKACSAVASLRNLNRTSEELWNDILVHIISTKLDPVTRKAWKLKFSNNKDMPSFEELELFLASRTCALEECKNECKHHDSSNIKLKPRFQPSSRVSSNSAIPNSISKCSLCSSKHYLSSCSQFLSRSPELRREVAKRANHCFNCLSKNHAVSECKSKHSCRLCNKRHHTRLHIASDSLSNVESRVTHSKHASTAAEPNNEIQSLCSTNKLNLRP